MPDLSKYILKTSVTPPCKNCLDNSCKRNNNISMPRPRARPKPCCPPPPPKPLSYSEIESESSNCCLCSKINRRGSFKL